MTCIVGYVHTDFSGQRTVYIGGDSSGVSGWSITTRKDPKVFEVGEFIIGFTSSFRMGQILQFDFNPPAIDVEEDVFHYMCTKFINEARAAFARNNFSERKDGQESGGHFLVGFRGRLFNIASDFQVGENTINFDAVGSGAEIAKGAMRACDRLGMQPERAVRLALEAAEEFNIGVKGPFTVIQC